MKLRAVKPSILTQLAEHSFPCKYLYSAHVLSFDFYCLRSDLSFNFFSDLKLLSISKLAKWPIVLFFCCPATEIIALNLGHPHHLSLQFFFLSQSTVDPPSWTPTSIPPPANRHNGHRHRHHLQKKKFKSKALDLQR